VDGSGSVVVIGQENDPIAISYLTIKYSGAGVPLWTNRYQSQTDLSWAQAVALDTQGNVFVTGRSGATVAYASAGIPLWTNLSDLYVGNSIGTDRNGNVFVQGVSWNGSTDDYVTVAYSGAGVPLWTNRYGPGGGMVVDDNGTVFETGSFLNASGFTDYATVAYSNAGLPLWTNRYHGPGVGNAGAGAIAVDGGGNVFVAGLSYSGSGYDPATVAYSGSGIPLWTNHAPDGYYGQDKALAVDGGGNVFVTGTSGSNDFVTVAYSGAGAPLWTNRYGDGSGGAAAIVADAAGNVFVTGGSNDYALVTVAYSGSGAPLWTNSYKWPGVYETGVYDLGSSGMAVDAGGNVFITGEECNTARNIFRFATVKYSSSMQAYLTVQPQGTNLVLNWTNSAFSLQSAPAAPGAFTNLPGATSPYTNALSATQQFFRLMAP
jgi:hypothetical protein